MTSPFIPYLPIEKHGVIGDRRTAALVAADGTLDWLCLPDYDGTTTFATLVEAERAGFWRLGPADRLVGQQRYLQDSAVLATTWSTREWELELIDFMESPGDERDGDAKARSVVRLLRCVRGRAWCRLDIRPCYEFDQPAAATQQEGHIITFDLDSFETTLWASLPLDLHESHATGTMELLPGEQCCAVYGIGTSSRPWSIQRAQDALEHTLGYWQNWHNSLTYDGPHAGAARRSATIIHLLTYAPTGSSVAAPTTSLPERIGGSRNYDYRFAWIRDASLAAGALSLMGDTRTAGRYMAWLAGLDSNSNSPLQVAYGINGEMELKQEERTDAHGYRESLPIRLGNDVYKHKQMGSLGYLADCAKYYLDGGGKWEPVHWQLLERVANYVAAHWTEEDQGIWELPAKGHHVSSKVMAWSTLGQAIDSAGKTRRQDGVEGWRRARDEIHAEVLKRGWSQRLQAFRQTYGADTLDASVLVIPLTGFLPPDDPRVRATIERIEQQLMLNGFVYRFEPASTEGAGHPLLLGDFEGSFLPCSFMLATAYALCGELEKAEAMLARTEAAAGDLGIFAEELDARSLSFLGNTPLLFSHAEHIRAVHTLAQARGQAGCAIQPPPQHSFVEPPNPTLAN